MVSLKVVCVLLCLQIFAVHAFDDASFLRPFSVAKTSGSTENDYMLFDRSDCEGQDIKGHPSTSTQECLKKCDELKECKVITFDSSRTLCLLKSACDNPRHLNGHRSYVSRELCGSARPRHHIVSAYITTKVLSATKLIFSADKKLQGATLNIQQEKSNDAALMDIKDFFRFENEQHWYAEDVPGTGYFRIFSPKHPELAVDVKDRIAADGQEVRLWPWTAWVVNRGQLWRWKTVAEPQHKGRALESALDPNFVLHVDPKDKTTVTLHRYIGGGNQQWKFEF